MEGILPISAVLNACVGTRHAIPHRTFRADLHSKFFAYLISSDNRLPDHPLLNVQLGNLDDYESYVGDDIWRKDNANEVKRDDEANPPAKFDDIVAWVSETMQLDWAADGVTVCGRYYVATDCDWLVSTRTMFARNPRDVFLMLKMSTRLFSDFKQQKKDAQDILEKEAFFEFSLVKSLEGPESREMRAFVPYRIVANHSTDNKDPSRGYSLEMIENFVGISQRETEACLPSLMKWTEADHHENFTIVLNYIKSRRFLERVLESYPRWLTRLIEWKVGKHVEENKNQRNQRGSDADNKSRLSESPENFILFLAIDFFFDTPTCPLFTTSAKARLFEAHAVKAAEGIPYLRVTEDDETPLDDNTVTEPSTQTNQHGIPSTDVQKDNKDNGDAEENEDEEDEETEIEVKEEPLVRFFRLFRDEHHWNTYVDEIQKRILSLPRSNNNSSEDENDENDEEEEEESDTDAAASPPIPNVTTATTTNIVMTSNKPHWRRYFIFATEMNDLVSTGEIMDRMGLPLEFFRPELIQGHPELLELIEQMKQNMKKNS